MKHKVTGVVAVEAQPFLPAFLMFSRMEFGSSKLHGFNLVNRGTGLTASGKDCLCLSSYLDK